MSLSSFKSSRRLWAALLLLLLAAVACIAWMRREAASPPPQARGSEPRPLLVRNGNRLFVPGDSALRSRLAVAEVGEQSGPHQVELPAVVEAQPSRTVNVLPPAIGRVVDLGVRLGDTVKRGQLLALVSAPDFAQAATDVQKARDGLELARQSLTRAHGVNEAGSNATKDVEAAESAVVQQGAELRRAELRLQSLNAGNATLRKDGLLELRAPLGGTISALGIAAGTVLNDATAAVMTISNLEQVWVTANVPEELVGAVAAGDDAVAVLAAYPHQVFSGKVEFVAALMDADSRRVKARIAFANPSGLFKPNMFARVRISVPQAPQPQVPSSALLMNNDAVSVFVEADPWTFVRRTVETGSEEGDGNGNGSLVRIRSGLNAGERIVVRGGVLLND